jgi:tetratricopeptide (TPR) repeat protein
MKKKRVQNKSQEVETLSARPRLLAAGVALIVLTLLAYIPAMRGGFVWDDDAYVTKNPLLTAPDGLRRIWFSLDSPSQYFPLVYTTFRFEHAIWGLDPLGYHIVNVLLHAINALLVWTLLRRLSIPGAWLAGAIFALHPVHVESVAWITERKNVLSTLFYLLAILAWLRFTAKSTVHPWRHYGLAIGLYALALLAKTMACTLPAALVLVLWLQKEKVDRRRWAQVTPFVLMGLAMGLVSIWWEKHHQGTAGPEFALVPMQRILIASRALWFYLGKLVWPSRLTFSYPRWEIDPSEAAQYVWLAACLVAAAALWHWRRAIGRGTIAGLVFFAAALAPMLGFISLYTFRYSFVADHYQYVASIGLIAIAASIIAGFVKQNRVRAAVSLILLVLLGSLTWRQGYAYRDAETLWRDTIAKNPTSWMAHNDLGIVLADQGRLDEAMAEYKKALRIKPDHANAMINLGAAMQTQGKLGDAIRWYSKALRGRPDFAEGYYYLGIALGAQGKLGEAVRHYSEAVKINPYYVSAYVNLGSALAQQGKTDQAIRNYSRALKIDPYNAEAHYNLGVVLLSLDNSGEAKEHFERALETKPDYAEAHTNLGNVLAAERKVDEAAAHYRKALRLKPDLVEARNNLASVLYFKGDYAGAWRQIRLCRRYGGTPHPGLVKALREKMPEP